VLDYLGLLAMHFHEHTASSAPACPRLVHITYQF